MIQVRREKLEKIVKEEWEQASPYTGEYHMGKADLANDLLGNPEIDWDKHPRSIENMIKNQGIISNTAGLINIKNIPFRTSTPLPISQKEKVN